MSLTRKGARTLQDYGVLQTDKYGTSTATARWYDPDTGAPTLPAINSAHPLWTSLKAERIIATHNQTHWTVEVAYAGIYGDAPTAVYELDYSVSDEPIQTHPHFGTFAGSPGSEVNGAKFDSDGLFLDFNLGTKQGVRSYLAPGATWRKTVVQTTAPTTLGAIGSVSSPEGSPPTVPSGRTWLSMGVTYEQRGGCYTVRSEWKLSGARGWDADIYSS